MARKIRVEIDLFLKDIIPKFLESRRSDIKALRDSLNKENYENIESIAHKIKGNAGSYGFDKLGEIGGELEQNCINKNYGRINEYIDAMEDYLEHLVISYVVEEDEEE